MSLWCSSNSVSRMSSGRRSYLPIFIIGLIVIFLLSIFFSTTVRQWQDIDEWLSLKPSSAITTPARLIELNLKIDRPSYPKTKLTGDVPGYMVSRIYGTMIRCFEFPIIQVFRGSTIFLNDHPDVNPMLLAWFYHFASEEILGALAALSSTTTTAPVITNHSRVLGQSGEMDNLDERNQRRGSLDVPELVIIPWAENWRDPYGLNEALVKGVWEHGVMEPKEWAELEEQGPIHFERIVIVDRQAAGRAPLSSKWNKMALNVLTHPHPEKFFEPLRKPFLSSLDIPIRHDHLYRGDSTISDAMRQPVRLVYIDRQATNRRLSDESHEAVMRTLGRLEEDGKIVWMYGQFNEMDIRRQVEVTAEADILLGVHGNGLTHQLWMAPGGAVVEIFPAGTFTRDYQVLAKAMGHEHYYFRNNETLSREQWELVVDEQNPGPLYDGTRIELDESFLSTFLDTLVQKYRQ